MRPNQYLITNTLMVRPNIHIQKEVRRRIEFLKSYLLYTGLNGYVLGISGGVDSTNAGRLAQLAVNQLNEEKHGKTFKFVAMRLPYGVQLDEDDAQAALNFIEPTESIAHDIKPQVDAAMFQHKLQGREISDFVKGNNKARTRMLAQYDIAAQDGLLVIGTDHAAEAITGFFTKFGDGACDVAPLSGLTKRQGREIAKYLGAPEKLYTKVPTADLLDGKPGQTDETELGLTYEQIDDYLESKDVNDEIASKLEKRYFMTNHKRTLPVTPDDFEEIQKT